MRQIQNFPKQLDLLCGMVKIMATFLDGQYDFVYSDYSFTHKLANEYNGYFVLDPCSLSKSKAFFGTVFN